MAQASAAATDTSPFQCARCQSGTAPSVPPEQGWDGVSDPKEHRRTIAAGEIWGIRESITVPIYELLGADHDASLSRPSWISSANSWSFTPTAEENDIAHGRKHAVRPCILMMDHSPNHERCNICLMATFRGTKRREDLVEILRDFCIAVHPHVLSANENHLHFTPEWESDCAWLLAFRFSSQRPLEKPFLSRVVAAGAGNDKAAFKADDEVIEQIETLSRERYTKWKNKCASDPFTVKRCLQEYRDFRARAYGGRR